MANITELKNISDIASRYDGFVIDLQGVIHNEEKIYKGALNALKFLREEDKKIVLLANSSRRVKKMAFILKDMGLDRDLYDGILTSGEVIYHDLKNKADTFFKKLGRKYYYIGTKNNRLQFETAGYDCVKDLTMADFIIMGDITDKDDIVNNYIPMFQEALAMSLPMVCADPDRISLIAGNIPIMGPGYVAEKYSKMGGYVFFRGKPKPESFLYCLEGMGIEDKSRVLVIGDGFETDIMGGHYASFDFTLSSIHLA